MQVIPVDEVMALAVQLFSCAFQIMEMGRSVEYLLCAPSRNMEILLIVNTMSRLEVINLQAAAVTEGDPE